MSISKLTDRTAGGTISSAADDNEFSQIIDTLNAHTDFATGVHSVGAGDVVGTTLSQALTNKTLTSPDINGGTWNGTIDGNWTAASQTCADLGTVSAATSITSSIGLFADGHVYGQPLLCTRTIIYPEGVQPFSDGVPLLPVEDHWAPYGILVTKCGVKLDANLAYSVAFEDWTSNYTVNATLSTLNPGAGAKVAESGDLTSTIAAGNILAINLPATAPGPAWLNVWVVYEIKAS